MTNFRTQSLFFIFAALVGFSVLFVGAPFSFAESLNVSATLSPTGNIYPGTYITLSGSVNGPGYTGSNCWSYNGSSCWFSAGSGEGTFSTAWNAGGVDGVNYTFYLCADNGGTLLCGSGGSLKVVNPPPPAPPSVSATLSPTGNIYPGTSITLSGSVSGSGYTGSNCWSYTGNSCWFGAGSGNGTFSTTWNAGGVDGVDYTFYLCANNGALCSSGGSLRVVTPPTLSASLSPSSSSIMAGSSVSFTTSTGGTATGISYSGQSCGGGSISGVSGGSFTCTYGSAGSYTASVTVSGTSVSSVSPTASVSVSPLPIFNYSINPPTSVATLVQGNASSVYVTTSLISAPALGVTLSVSGLPFGVTASVVPSTEQTPSSEYRIDFTAALNSAVGTFPITVTGSLLGKTTTFNLTVAVPTFSATLNSFNTSGPSVNTVLAGNTLNFTTSYAGTAAGAITYSGQTCGAGNTVFNISAGSFSCTFTSTGNRTVSTTLTRQGIVSTATKLISVTAPPNTVSIQSTVDGVSSPGAGVEFLDGSFVGAVVTTENTQTSPSAITTTLQSVSSFGGGSFMSWSGCDSVRSRRRCDVTVTNGATKTVSVNYGTAAYQAVNGANFYVSGVVLNGDKYKGTSTYVTNTINDSNVNFVATLSNNGKVDGTDVGVSFELSTDGANYSAVAAPNYIKGASGAALLVGKQGGTQKIYAILDLTPGVYYIRACADPSNTVAESNESDNCSGGSQITVSTPPRPPSTVCIAAFTNTTSANADQDVSSRAAVSVANCPSDYYQGLNVSGNAWTSPTASIDSVLDIGAGLWRGIASGETIDSVHSPIWNLKAANGSCLLGSQNSAPYGGGLEFGPINVYSGYTSTGSFQYVSGGSYCDAGNPYIKFGGQNTYWGQYNYEVRDRLGGTFNCYIHTDTPYVPETGTYSAPIEYRGDSQTISVESYVGMCFGRNNVSRGDKYYKQNCGQSQPGTQTFTCPGGNAQVTITNTNTGLTNTPLVPIHTLNVTSTLDNSSSPGVSISQVGNAVAVDGGGTPVSPAVIVVSVEGGDFGGTTDYTRTAIKNYTVILEAPANHSSATGTFTGWGGGCTSTSSVPGDPVGTPNRRCVVSFVFTAAGGQTKTVTANYTAVVPPPAPKVTASGGYCGGNINLAYVNSASGATSYELWRQPANSAWGKVETQSDTKLFRSLDHLSPSTSYSYYVKAIGAGGSTQSPTATQVSSSPCTITLQAKPSGSASPASATALVAYNSPADLLWSMPTNPPPPPNPDCRPTLSSVSGTFTGSLPTTGTASTASLLAQKVFTITCKDLDYPPPQGATWSSSATVNVYLLKPTVQLYISKPGESCLTLNQKTATIVKGNTSTLCWKVTTTPVTQ